MQNQNSHAVISLGRPCNIYLNAVQILNQQITFSYYYRYKWSGLYQNVIATNHHTQTICSVTLYIITYTVLRTCTSYIRYTSAQYPYNVLHTYLVCCPVLFISFISPASTLLKWDCSLLFGRYLLLSALSFHISSFFQFVSHSSSIFFFYPFSPSLCLRP